MCDPLTIAGIALTGGSLAANTIANNKIQNARNDVMAAERIRQNRFDQEADALNAQSQNRYLDFEGQQGDRASELGQYFADQQIDAGNQNAAASDQMLVPQSGSDIVVREEAKKRDEARDFTNDLGMKLGNLRAFGDVMGTIGREQAKDASLIGQINKFKMGSQGVVPFELEGANSAGSGMKLLGDVLGLAGNLTMTAGLSKGQKFPDAPPTPAEDPWWGLRGKGESGNLYSLYKNKTGLF